MMALDSVRTQIELVEKTVSLLVLTTVMVAWTVAMVTVAPVVKVVTVEAGDDKGGGGGDDDGEGTAIKDDSDGNRSEAYHHR